MSERERANAAVAQRYCRSGTVLVGVNAFGQ